MDSNKAATISNKTQILQLLEAERSRILGLVKAEVDNAIDQILDKLVDLSIESARQHFLRKLTHPHPELSTPSLPEATTGSGTCLVPVCPGRGAKYFHGFCGEHNKSLTEKEKQSYIEAHKERRRKEFNLQRRVRREQQRAASRVSSER